MNIKKEWMGNLLCKLGFHKRLHHPYLIICKRCGAEGQYIPIYSMTDGGFISWSKIK